MAGAEVIGAAIGVLLLILVGYIMVGSSLTSADIVITAQKDVTLQNEVRLRTFIEIENLQVIGNKKPYGITFDLKNTGSEPIGDFTHLDVFLAETNKAPIRFKFNNDPGSQGDGIAGTWGYTLINPDQIHQGMLDPSEVMSVDIINIQFDTAPILINVITANGVPATQNY